jgi:hypothetical protein
MTLGTAVINYLSGSATASGHASGPLVIDFPFVAAL